MTDRKMRREALEMLRTIRAVLADQLAAAVELGRCIGPVSGGLVDALALAVREASGLSVLVNETLKEVVHDFEEKGAQTERDAALARSEGRDAGACGGHRGDHPGADRGADGSRPGG